MTGAAEDQPSETPHGGITPGLFGGRAGLEGWLSMAILLMMTALPVAETIARKVFRTSIPGAAVYVQHGTLWIGFVGALLATGRGKHLGLSTAEMLPKGWKRTAVQLLGAMVTTAVVALLAYASVKLVLADRMREDTLAGGIPEWWSELIMPTALTAMGFRAAWRAPLGWRGRAACSAAVGLAFSIGLFADHAAAFAWPVALIIAVAFLLGAPVFVAHGRARHGAVLRPTARRSPRSPPRSSGWSPRPRCRPSRS